MIIYKGKGILIIAYFVVSAIGLALAYRTLIEVFALYPEYLSFMSVMGIILIATGIWTRLTANTYYRNDEGRKVILEEVTNSLFFIKMSVWGIILSLAGIVLTIYGFIAEHGLG